MADYKSKFTGAEIDDRLNKMLNVTWDELVALRDEGKLIPGQKYRMINYETTCTWEDTQVAGHPFDLVLTALDNKTLDEKCSAIQSERDTDGYFANSNLAAWDVRYCLDNDKNRFDWASGGTTIKVNVLGGEFEATDWGRTHEIEGITYYLWIVEDTRMPILCKTPTPKIGDEIYISMDGSSIGATGQVIDLYEKEGGKGVIYRLIDEVGNSVPYDFKNIMFGRPLLDGKLNKEDGVLAFCYTFSCIDEDSFVIEDKSVKEPYCCYNNKFAVGCEDNIFLTFSAGNCYSNTFGNDCNSNTFGDSCYSNTFGDDYSFNTFGDSCYSNTFGNDCNSNTFGDSCYSNTFGNDCGYNTFGDSCYSNTFGNDCNSNTFGDSCSNNTFGNICRQNTFGNGCDNNTFGNGCNENGFGNSCSSNTFGNNCDENGFTLEGNVDPFKNPLNGCCHNYFEDGVSGILLWIWENSEETEIRYVKVAKGVGISNISHEGVIVDAHANGPQVVVCLKDGGTRVFYYDDIINA